MAPIPPRLNDYELSTLPEIVVIGTSTGGPAALQQILPKLAPDLPVGVIVLQHMPPGFTQPLAKRLNELSAIKVKEAEHGEIVEAGTVYIAPAGRHLIVHRHTRSRAVIALCEHPLDTPHRPSVDVTMLAVAHAFQKNCIGIILTGMGKDGLRGMTAIHDAGGITIGQDQATSAVYGMPRVCAEKGVLQKIVPVTRIAWQIQTALRHNEKIWQARKQIATEAPRSAASYLKQF